MSASLENNERIEEDFMQIESAASIRKDQEDAVPFRLTCIPFLYEAAFPKGLRRIETSTDAFYLIGAISDGEKPAPVLIRHDLIELLVENGIFIELVSSAIGFPEFKLPLFEAAFVTYTTAETVQLKIEKTMLSELGGPGSTDSELDENSTDLSQSGNDKL